MERIVQESWVSFLVSLVFESQRLGTPGMRSGLKEPFPCSIRGPAGPGSRFSVAVGYFSGLLVRVPVGICAPHASGPQGM